VKDMMKSRRKRAVVRLEDEEERMAEMEERYLWRWTITATVVWY
jgi:hypothetical protein